MRTLKFILLMVLSVLVISCSKSKDDDLNFTPVIGDWIDMNGSSVNVFHITGRSYNIKVTDDGVNEVSAGEGTPLFYIKQSGSSKTNYFHLPNSIVGLGETTDGKLDVNGYSLACEEDFRASTSYEFHIRGIVIPKGKTLPAGIDPDSYPDVKTFLKIKD